MIKLLSLKKQALPESKSPAGLPTTGRESTKKWLRPPKRRTKISVSNPFLSTHFVDFVREIIKLKFDKDLDQSLSLS